MGRIASRESTLPLFDFLAIDAPSEVAQAPVCWDCTGPPVERLPDPMNVLHARPSFRGLSLTQLLLLWTERPKIPITVFMVGDTSLLSFLLCYSFAQLVPDHGLIVLNFCSFAAIPSGSVAVFFLGFSLLFS